MVGRPLEESKNRNLSMAIAPHLKISPWEEKPCLPYLKFGPFGNTIFLGLTFPLTRAHVRKNDIKCYLVSYGAYSHELYNMPFYQIVPSPTTALISTKVKLSICVMLLL